MNKSFIFLLTAAALAGALSCSKSQGAAEPAGPQRDGAITVTIATDTDTKAAFVSQNTTDRKINSVQIFVFDKDGKLETDYWDGNAASTAASAASGSYQKTIATFAGDKTVYAVVNRARLALPKEFPLAKFEGRDASVYANQYGASAACTILSDLSENSYGEDMNLVMSGFNTVTVSEYNTNKIPGDMPEGVNIVVKRLAAMVMLKDITVNFANTSLEGASFVIKDIYLRNVVGRSCVGMTDKLGSPDAAGESSILPVSLQTVSGATFGNVASWYNRGAASVNKGPAVTFDDNIGQTVSNVSGTATPVGRALLAYPNPQDEDSNAQEFGPRHTRLVIKALIQKEGVFANEAEGTCWYTFDLPELKSNVIYKVANINITMFGSNADDDTLNDDPGRINAQISVKTWTEAEALNYDL